MKRHAYGLFVVFTFLLTFFLLTSPTWSKSVYIIQNINISPTPIQAYDVQPDGSLVLQTTYNVPHHGWGAVGLALDTQADVLFVTYEFSNTIQLLDAKTMTDLGTTVAPNAFNLAGIVLEQSTNRLFTVDRNSNKLYEYNWDSSTLTLTLLNQYLLPGGETAYGLALDQTNSILYISNGTNTITYYHTSDFTTLLGTLTLSNTAIGIAVDPVRGYLYYGAGYANNYNIARYDLSTGTEISSYLGLGIGVMGMSVDLTTGIVYFTTGYYGDDLRGYDSNLNVVYNSGNLGGDPTGVVVGAGYNPLNLAKDDGIAPGDSVCIDQNFTYTIIYNNLLNSFAVDSVIITDQLPSGLDYVSCTGGGNYSSATHSVSWFIGTMSAGDPGDTLRLTVHVNSSASPGDVLINYCTIESKQTGPSTVTETTPVKTCGAVTEECVLCAKDDIELFKIDTCYGDLCSWDDIHIYEGSGSLLNGNLRAVDDIEIEESNIINGDATAGGTIELEGSAMVTGTITEDSIPEICQIPDINFTAGGQKIRIRKYDTLYIAPGSYGRLRCGKHAAVRLSAGEYYFEWFEIDKYGSVLLDLSGGDITLNITEKFYMKDYSQFVIDPAGSGSTQDIHVNVCGHTKVRFKKYVTFLGNLLAPYTKVQAQKHFRMKGSIKANRIWMGDYAFFVPNSSSIPLPKITYPEEPPTTTLVSSDFELFQNYPNPFNPETMLKYSLPVESRVKLQVYNILGELVTTLVETQQSAGLHSVKWNGTNRNGQRVSSGIYIYRLEAEPVDGSSPFIQVRRMILMK